MLPLALKRRLAKAHMPIGMAILAFVLGLPSLRLGLAMDDRWHRAMLQHDLRWIPATRAPWDLFTFVRGDAAERAVVLEKGMLPWWISEDLRVSFFRPVASISHALDHWLWPSSPAVMHVHSLLWYVGLVALASVLYRRLLRATSAAPWIAGLAGLLYAVDGTHGLPVGWIANRNALLAATFALGALLAHDARRPIIAAALLALGLGSGESAVGVLGYYAAHFFFLDDRPRYEKLRAVAPSAVVAVAWAVVHHVGRYGVRGSSLYVDPKHEPLGFLANLVHLPLLAGAELGAPTPDLYMFVGTRGKAFFLGFALVVVVAALFAGRALLRRSKEARFFLAGGTLALIPACSVMPAARLLMIAGFGLVGFLAMLAEEPGKAARRYVWWAVVVRLVLSPIVFTAQEHGMVIMANRVDTFGEGIPRDPSVVDKRLVLLNAPDTAFAYYMTVDRRERDEPVPHRMLIVAGGYRDVTITRVDDRTLDVKAAEGFYRQHTDLLFRTLGEVTPVGKRYVMSDCVITTTHALPDGVIDEARYEFSEPLESAHWLVMESRGGRVLPATIPKVGETRTLAGTPLL